MKSKVAILIAMAIIASVLAAGCTSNTNQSAQSTSGGTSHDAVIQAVISDDLQAYNSAQWVRSLNQSVQWVNATTAMVTYKMSNQNRSLNYTANYTKLGSIAKANEYISTISQGYNATSAAQLIGFPALTTASSLNEHKNYLNITQSLPSTNSYIKMERATPTAPASYIIQVDDVVITFNATFNNAAS